MGSGFIFYAIAMVVTQALNGAGDSKTPTIINFICFWLFQIPFAYLLSKVFKWESTGVLVAIPAAQAMIAVMGWYYFKKGNWKKIKL